MTRVPNPHAWRGCRTTLNGVEDHMTGLLDHSPRYCSQGAQLDTESDMEQTRHTVVHIALRVMAVVAIAGLLGAPRKWL